MAVDEIKRPDPSDETATSNVAPDEYDEDWIRTTWGTDVDEFVRSAGAEIRPRVGRAIELARVRPGMRVLDIGSGRGEVVLECARRGAHAVGADYSEAAISVAERARANAPSDVRDRARFILGDVKQIDIGVDRFDRVFMLDLVEHLHDWELITLFDWVKDVLADDGQIIIHTLPNRWVYDITYGRLIRAVAPWLKKNPRNPKEMAIHVNEMSITHLDQLLASRGLSSHIWLEEWITHQAQWHADIGHDRDADDVCRNRGRLYRLMENPWIAATYKALAVSPARFLVVNDIFSIAWRNETSLPVPTWHGWMERIVCLLGRRLSPWAFPESDGEEQD